MPGRTHLAERVGPRDFAEDYGDETVYLTEGNLHQLAQVIIHRDDARELVNILRCGLNANRSDV
jgi:hypothetical protein